MVFKDIEVAGKEAMFNVGLHISGASTTIWLLFDCDCDITPTLILDSESVASIKGG